MKQNFEITVHPTQTLNVNGAKIVYDVFVPKSNEPKTELLLLINGFQRTRLDFRVFRQKLGSQCANTITVSFDNRFSGETEVTQDPESTTLNDFANDALLVLKHCMEQFKISSVHVLGISMGGMIAQLLTQLPDCPKLQTLFLVSTTPGGSHRVWPKNDILQQSHLNAELSTEMISKRLSYYFGQKFLKNSPLLFKMFVQNMEKSLHSSTSQKYVRNQAAASKIFEGVEDFTKLNANKVVIITGDEDHIMPHENAEVMHKLIPNSDLIVYPEIGHLILIENPNQFLTDVSSYLPQGTQS